MSAALKRMRRVLDADDAGMDEGRWFVTLQRGWAFSDAAERLEDDPEGATASHCRSGTVKELQAAIREAQPCQCGRCSKKEMRDD